MRIHASTRRPDLADIFALLTRARTACPTILFAAFPAAESTALPNMTAVTAAPAPFFGVIGYFDPSGRVRNSTILLLLPDPDESACL